MTSYTQNTQGSIPAEIWYFFLHGQDRSGCDPIQPPFQRGKRPEREADLFQKDAEGLHKR
jgi:hypothetical protein